MATFKRDIVNLPGPTIRTLKLRNHYNKGNALSDRCRSRLAPPLLD